MPDDLTTGELVKLAVLCGYTVQAIFTPQDDDVVYSPHIVVGGEPVKWCPHLDANQRDKIVEALFARGIETQYYRQDTGHGCEIYDERNRPCGYVYKQPTPGLAVCRAALKAIGETK